MQMCRVRLPAGLNEQNVSGGGGLITLRKTSKEGKNKKQKIK
jgi:hypothetical protein